MRVVGGVRSRLEYEVVARALAQEPHVTRGEPGERVPPEQSTDELGEHL